VTDYLTVKFDANNLTGESFHQYGNNKVPSAGTGFSQDFPVYEYEMARRYTIGASFKF
jgi:iron complex outermembrane recepter protein